MGYRNGQFVLTHQPDPEPPKSVHDSSKKKGTGQSKEAKELSAHERSIERLVRSRQSLNEELARLRASRDVLTKEVDALREEISSLQYQVRDLRKKKSFS